MRMYSPPYDEEYAKLRRENELFLRHVVDRYLRADHIDRLVNGFAAPLDATDRILRLIEIERLRGLSGDEETARIAAAVITGRQLIVNVEHIDAATVRDLELTLEDGILLYRLTPRERSFYRSSTDAIINRLRRLIEKCCVPWPDLNETSGEVDDVF